MNKEDFKCPICGETKKIVSGIKGKYNNATVLLCRKCKFQQNKGLKPRQIRDILSKSTK
jgi:transcription elongation factor Elf1